MLQTVLQHGKNPGVELPHLAIRYASIADLVAAFDSLLQQATWRGQWDQLDENVSVMVPESLRNKAWRLALDAAAGWDQQLWRLCRYRRYSCSDAAELHMLVNFLRRCSDELLEEALAYRWRKPGSFQDATPERILRFAAPLLRGEWPPHDPGRWCATLEGLQQVEDVQTVPDRERFGLVDLVWDMMRRVPGEGRPLQPRRLRTLQDLDRALDIAVLWCERQAKRDRRAATRPRRLIGV